MAPRKELYLTLLGKWLRSPESQSHNLHQPPHNVTPFKQSRNPERRRPFIPKARTTKNKETNKQKKTQEVFLDFFFLYLDI